MKSIRNELQQTHTHTHTYLLIFLCLTCIKLSTYNHCDTKKDMGSRSKGTLSSVTTQAGKMLGNWWLKEHFKNLVFIATLETKPTYVHHLNEIN